jgi:protease-4
MSRFCLGLLALALLGVVTWPVRADDKPKKDDKNTKGAVIAHIRLHGDLDETPVANETLFGAMGENFKTKLERIQKAQADSNVQALYVHVDGLAVGWAKMDELRKALADFKKSGKKVYAYLESGMSKDYFVAAQADQVAMPPSGYLMLVGMRAELMFFKNLLEKLGIKADFLQMGAFKAAAEPFTNEKASPEAKAQFKLVLEDFFNNSYLGSISRSRGKKLKGNAQAIVDDGLLTTSKAMSLGLVDQSAYAHEFEEKIKKDVGPGAKVVRDYGKAKHDDIDFSNPFAIFKMFAPSKTTSTGKKDKIALVYAVGSIHTGKSSSSIFGGSTVGSTTLVEAIRKADEDPKVKAIVLRVDSPGGSALASDLIWQEIKRCKKPVIASMSDVAASGGYYICMSAKKIYADPGTLTGSIGVISGKLATKGLYDKVGITTESISFGKNSGLLSSNDSFTPSEREAMTGFMKEIYNQFLDKAIEGRGKAGKTFTRETLLALADGRIWTGRQAKERGLVDELGGFDDAIADAKIQGGLAKDADVEYLILPKPRSFLDSLLEGGGLDLSLAATLSPEMRKMAATPELRGAFRTVEGLFHLRGERVWLMMPYAIEMK